MAKKAAAEDKRTVVVLRRSPIGEKPKVRATVDGLGLRKLHQSKELPDNPSVRGMIHKVRHLVEVQEVAPPDEIEAPKRAPAAKKAPAKKAPAAKKAAASKKAAAPTEKAK